MGEICGQHAVIRLLVIYLLMLSACGHLPRHVAKGDWRQFDAGNRLGAVTWNGTACVTNGDELVIRGVAGGVSRCESSELEITPGHYDFTLRLAAQDLELSNLRRMTDALSIHLQLYDRSGKEMTAKEVFLGQPLDPHELNYGLNRLTDERHLHEPSRLQLAPRFHPYDGVWISPNTAKARLIITLRGPGEVRLSHCDARYSRWNFSLRERVEYLGKKAAPQIFPVPQVNRDSGRSLVLEADQRLCVLGDAKLQGLEDGVLQLNQRLQRLGLPQTAVFNSCRRSDQRVNVRRVTLREGPEAYVLTPDLVVQAGSGRAAFYALQTLAQLITAAGDGRGRIGLREIRDFPSFPFRATSSWDVRRQAFSREIHAGHWLSESRLNAIFLMIGQHNRRWWEKDGDLIWAARLLGQEAMHRGLFDLGIYFNIYGQRKDPNLRQPFALGSPDNQQQMRATLEPLFQGGARHLFLATDDFPPRQEGAVLSYRLDHAADEEALKTLEGAHAMLLNKFSKWLSQSRLYFVPPWYNNLFVDVSEANQGRPYLEGLTKGMAADVPLLWTGPTVRSLWIDPLHVRRYQAWTGNQPLILWDNTLYARRLDDYWGASPVRAHLASSFEPYSVDVPDSLAGVFINSQVTEFYRIQLATAGAYLWNPRAYQPEAALWAYLLQRFGAPAADRILELDGALWQVRELRNRGEKRQMKVAMARAESGFQILRGLIPHEGALLDEFREAIEQQR